MHTKIFKGIILLVSWSLFSFTNKEIDKENNLPMKLSSDKAIFIGPIILEKDGIKIELILAGNPIAGHKNLTKVEPKSNYQHAYEIKIQNFEIKNFNNSHYNYIYINTLIWEMNKKEKKGLNIIK